MKPLISCCFLFLSLLLFPFSLSAGEEEDFYPWKIKGEYTAVGNAKFDEPGRTEEEISYSQSRFKASYTHNFDRENALVFDIGYSITTIDWDENPSFSDTTHPALNLRVGGFSRQIPNWVWAGAVGTDISTTEFKLSHNAQYNGIMWGRYNFSNLVGIHVGLTGASGLRKDSVFPIVGIDYTPNAVWKLNVVFPIDLSVIYTLNENWTVAAVGRTFRSRHRLSRKEILSRGIFEYRSFGTELALNYDHSQFAGKAYVGSTLGGDLKISDSQGKNASFYKYKSSLYFGGNLTYKY